SRCLSSRCPLGRDDAVWAAFACAEPAASAIPPLSLHDALPISDLTDLTTARRVVSQVRSPRSDVERTALEPPTDALAEMPDEWRSEEHTSELQSRENLVCRLLLEKKKSKTKREASSLAKTRPMA